MFFLAIATFYLLGDKLIGAYTVSKTALWILLGLAAIEIWGKVSRK
jgi:hypothetical protein